MKRNISLHLPGPHSSEDLDQPSIPRRRSPAQLSLSTGNLPDRDVVPPAVRSPPRSPNKKNQRSRSRSPSPGRRSGVGRKGLGGWSRRGSGTPGTSNSFLASRRSMFSKGNRGGRGRNEGDVDCAQKGPKDCSRLIRVLPCRKIATAVAVGLCVLAAGGASREILKKADRDSNPTPSMRGTQRKGQVLLSSETRYCSAPMDYPTPERPGGEGGDVLELRLLQVTIRHGDRSAIHEIPNADVQKWRCQPFSEEIQEKWEGVSRFSVENAEGQPLQRSFLPATFAADELGAPFVGQEGLCKTGQLTEVGIRQHLTLGDRMRQAYSSLLGGELQDDQVYVRSTDYTRTIESAAAFLMSFFPGSSEMTIITNEEENEEVMHGIGLKHSSKGVTGGHEKTLVGGCERAVELSKSQSGDFKPRKDVSADLAALFGDEMLGWKMTEAGDALHARSCYNMTLPCSSKGCVTPELALSVMSEADRQLCLRYVGAAGGGDATALSLYPFMMELLDNMKSAMSGESPWKFALFSGHDTVIAPLLASLGAYDCRWPPYASHVAFELWTKPDGSADGPRRTERRALQEESGGNEPGASAGDAVSVEEDVAGVGSIASAPPDVPEEVGGREDESEAFVRVTFNGQPVTHHITDCKDVDGPYGREFCPLSMLSKTIGRAIAPYDTQEKACQALENRN